MKIVLLSAVITLYGLSPTGKSALRCLFAFFNSTLRHTSPSTLISSPVFLKLHGTMSFSRFFFRKPIAGLFYSVLKTQFPCLFEVDCWLFAGRNRLQRRWCWWFWEHEVKLGHTGRRMRSQHIHMNIKVAKVAGYVCSKCCKDSVVVI